MNASLNAAIKKIGGVAETARKLDVSPQAVSFWSKRGWAPLKRAIQLERKTGISRMKMINPLVASLLAA